MPNYKLKPSDYSSAKIDGEDTPLITKKAFERFNASILGLGDITSPSTKTEALAAIFDLQSFTYFCKQIEPHLSVPKFLSAYLDWLLNQIRGEVLNKEHPEGMQLWCTLPFFIKSAFQNEILM